MLALDVAWNGTQLFNGLRTYQYDVAPACSGIRSLIAITAIAIIYAFTMFRGMGSRVLIMASALPLAVVGNTFRMMVIVLAAEFGGQAAGNQPHESALWSLLPYIPAIGGDFAGPLAPTYPGPEGETGQARGHRFGSRMNRQKIILILVALLLMGGAAGVLARMKHEPATREKRKNS